MLDINVLGMNNNLNPDETVNTVIYSNVTNKINFRCKRIMQYTEQNHAQLRNKHLF